MDIDDDYFEYFEEEGRIEDLLEDSIAMLTDELKTLRNVARNLIRYDEECLSRTPRTLRLDEIIEQARNVIAKHGDPDPKG